MRKKRIKDFISEKTNRERQKYYNAASSIKILLRQPCIGIAWHVRTTSVSELIIAAVS